MANTRNVSLIAFFVLSASF